MKIRFSIAASTLALLTSAGVATAQHHLIDAKACSDLRSDKYTKLVRQLKTAPKNSVDVATHQVIYTTFKDLAEEAKKNRTPRVSADGFRALFVLGSGRNKRALMYKSNSECIWVKAR
ncbi:hypothetical protein [uncultured Tateyamaria sp.]|uniref:hypothetical protein n=1 Tax=uncultured Tateyamaria sp. TaxID=455651 RepID=UPI002625AAB2|nr:hypothetical protein [uncultured Tateyamaria sp.]